MKKIMIVLLSIMLAVAFTACGGSEEKKESKEPDPKTTVEYHSIDAIKDRGVLTVSDCFFGKDSRMLKGEDGSYSGVNYNVAATIAADMGVEVKVKGYKSAEAALAAVEKGDVDMSISSYTITEERQEKYSVSDDYCDHSLFAPSSDHEIVVLKGEESKYTSLDSLKGKKIGAPKGTVQYTDTQKALPDTTIKGYDDDEACMEALKAGKIDAVVPTFSVRNEITTKYSDLAICSVTIPELGKGWGIIMMKDNSSLTDFVNEEIAKFLSDGRLTTWIIETYQ